MILLQRPRRRQYVMRAPARRVQIHVDRDHQVETRQCLIQPRAIGGGEHGVACNDEQRLDLALTWRFHFFSHGGGWKLAEHLSVAGDAGVMLADAAGPEEVQQVHDRRATEQPAFAVELA